MKRVILLLTLALFLIGMTVPCAIFAANNSDKTAAFDRDNVRGTSFETQDLCPHVPDIDRSCRSSALALDGGKGCQAGPSRLRTYRPLDLLRHIFGRYFISRLPGTGLTIIDISWIDQDDPLKSQHPPGWNGEPSDRPDTDDYGWEDQNK